MAKRKAARATGRKTAGKRAGASRARSRAAGSARKTRKKGAARTSAARRTRATARKAPKKVVRKATKKAARKAVKTVARNVTRKATVRQAPRRRPGQATARASSVRGTRAAKKVGGRPAAAITSARKVPALNRERRIVRDDDLVPMPPSSLDFNRSASSVRTGRRELTEKFHQHTEASPALTGGDIDADWESAYAVGDEAPGGDNPTPDQSIVDDIGKAIGVQYEDNEELKGEKKISDRDKKRWELDPASADDYDDR